MESNRCFLCGTDFSSDTAFADHMRENPDHAPDDWIGCPWDGCGRKCETERSVKIHHKLSHGESIMEEVECDWCGNSFEILEWKLESETGGGRFCSDECDQEWRKNELVGENAGGWNGGKVEVECEVCGESREYHQSRADHRRCCSRECWNELYSDEYSGKNSPFWKENNEGRYGGSWEQRREDVVERDGFECSECGMSREEHRDRYGFDLHVHHIVPKRKFECDIDAHKEENLITLCAQCHYDVERLSVEKQKDRLKWVHDQA